MKGTVELIREILPIKHHVLIVTHSVRIPGIIVHGTDGRYPGQSHLLISLTVVQIVVKHIQKYRQTLCRRISLYITAGSDGKGNRSQYKKEQPTHQFPHLPPPSCPRS